MYAGERVRCPKNGRKRILPRYKGSGRYKGRRTLQKNKPRLHTGKLFGRVVTERIIQKIEFQVNDEQVGFRRGRKCVHRVFRL